MRHLALFFVALLLLPACSVKKATKKPEENLPLSQNAQVLGKMVADKAFEFEYLSFRGQGKFVGMWIDQNLSLVVRMKRHEVVWISAQAMLGIEVARALVTKDSVFVIQNFPDRKYMAYSLDSLSQILSVPLTVTQLQDFFIGNPLLPYEKAKVSMRGDSLLVEKVAQEFILTEFFANNLPKIAKNQLQSRQNQGSAEIEYLSFEKQDNKEMPVKVNIFVQRPDLTAQLDLQYTNISLEPISSFPFKKQN
ncbi:MAG: DUF4292 domain-containing protein [Bacteroidota bacterium]|nr:DUF4292 domain-containing protein [Bacteroidota bacterium]MDX5429697.1 DUF4292 domain-containing protein [Bacteroidota bacterium]MDX5468478.1 DUF4292 domain-containing protein [Bacteroidota bacterium]